MHNHPYTYGFRALHYVDGKPEGIRGGQVPATEILINPIQAVSEVLAAAGMADLKVVDAWLEGETPELPISPLVG